MTYRSNRLTGLHISKQKTKKIGKRSIYDILHNSFDLSFYEKLNYIRHHYVYYDGNYEYFHDKDGKSNSRKRYLNYLISQILKGQQEPGILKTFNQQILDWKNKRKQEEKENNKVAFHIWRIEMETDNNPSAQYFRDIISEFLKSKENNLTEETLSALSYKQLRKIAQLWHDNAEKQKDYEKIALERLAQSKESRIRIMDGQKTKEELHIEKVEQKRAEKLMREYAKDLGLLNEE